MSCMAGGNWWLDKLSETGWIQKSIKTMHYGWHFNLSPIYSHWVIDKNPKLLFTCQRRRTRKFINLPVSRRSLIKSSNRWSRTITSWSIVSSWIVVIPLSSRIRRTTTTLIISIIRWGLLHGSGTTVLHSVISIVIWISITGVITPISAVTRWVSPSNPLHDDNKLAENAWMLLVETFRPFCFYVYGNDILKHKF